MSKELLTEDPLCAQATRRGHCLNRKANGYSRCLLHMRVYWDRFGYY